MIQSRAQPDNSPNTLTVRASQSPRKHRLFLLVLVNFVALLTAAPSRAQDGNRDHLTPQESDIVRDTQELDKRIDVLVKAVERRFAIINGAPDPALKASSAAKSKKKKPDEEQDWGESPKGTRAELIGDAAGILDEAITNIDDVSRRDEKNPLIGKSLRKLADATKGFLSQLAALRPQAKNADELSVIERAIDYAQQIVEAATKAPAPIEDSASKKKKP